MLMMVISLSSAGENTHFLLSTLVKHLDHKNVFKEPEMQLEIVKVVTSLARHTKIKHSMALISSISDVMWHLRKSMHHSLDDAHLGADMIEWNRNFQEAVVECLVELCNKVQLIHFLFNHRKYYNVRLCSQFGRYVIGYWPNY